ncbi:Serine protease, subtilisin family [Nannocystis exedens]|uniref:Serine protease, subtilisin family n=1 Tax=Nannocystis exedens TaxID=54 RepID=A0A1I2DE97_9BACT|nr:S8 family serine peptidase [Nannocystis exedens]PCC70579.1 T9SS C-terminal target domain-containing protein [Nannocystis exedens]SFE78483.1 Serine protease, subtilisin family [Nannocystis exedens]
MPLIAALAIATVLLAPAPASDPPTWVFFADKRVNADELEAALARRADELAPRTMRRRVRVRGDRGVDVRDLSPASQYVQAIAATGVRIRTTSRWLNAVSVEADGAQRAAIAGLPFVAGLRPVARAQRADHAPLGTAEPSPSAAFGVAETQLALLGVPALRECGLTGAGVVIGVQDSGFSLQHQAFAGLHVLASRDFVQGDDVVADEPGDGEGQDRHGTMVLSLLAGDDGDAYSGVAPGVSVILAKTERVDEEEPYEEDLYVAGLEWIEGMGADLFTASLGYFDWYEHPQYDGKTAVVSQAAMVALANGLVMFTANGNEGPEPGTLIAPADVDGIIALGATNLDGVVADFSSRGPTSDGRTKPDLLAPGKDVWVVRPGTDNEYLQGNGTSFATPLAAGVGALLLEAYPELTPGEMLALLRTTASHPDAPDNDGGWGMIDGYAAAGLYCTCTDGDGDGHFASACGGDDCDDGDPARHPGAAEVCDGRDDDCDAVVPDGEVDGDGDGVLPCAGDCDDADPARRPGAPEDPDDCIDSDCDGEGDLACAPTTGGGSDTGESEASTATPTSGTTAADEPSTSSGASDSGGGASGDDGCACSTRGRGAPLGLLLGLAALRRRRPRSRVSSRPQ